MDLKPEKEKKEVQVDHSSWSNLATFEVFINNCNHALIAISIFYISWFCFTSGIDRHVHAHTWYSTIGYQFFMAEGIMATYNRNTFTMGLKSRMWKIHAHWILQVIGTGVVLYGTPLEIYHRDIENKRHFHSPHALQGIVSFILLIISFLSGISALFAAVMRKYIKPIFSKAVHNFISSACYVVGMVSIIEAYNNKKYMRSLDTMGMREIVMVFCYLNTILTMVGPIKAFWNQLRNR